MPVIEVDVSDNKFGFLKTLVECREEIVNEYNQCIDIDYTTNLFATNWDFVNLFHAKVGATDNLNQFPSISKFIKKVPKNIQISFIALSKIEYGDTGFHDEQWTKQKGYYRIHFPLDNIQGSSIFVVEDNGTTVEYRYELGKVYIFTNPYNSHKPNNFNENGGSRLMLLVDLVDKDENQDLDETELFDSYLAAHRELGH